MPRMSSKCPPSLRACSLYKCFPVNRPSVCPIPDPKSRMEGCSKLKIGRKEAHDMGDP